MPGRSFQGADGYRYGFQGQEQDDEIKGDGNSLNYKYRMHDPRIGRFLSVDPLMVKYPYYSPYTYSGNRVVDMIELEGAEPDEPKYKWTITKYKDYRHGAQMVINDKWDVFISLDNEGNAVHRWFNPSTLIWENFDLVQPERLAPQVKQIVFVTIGLVGGTVGAAVIIESAGMLLVEEGIEYIFEQVTGIPVVIDPIDVLEKGIKKGLLEGGYSGLEKWERKRAAEYVESGSSLKKVEPTPNGPKRADWIIDGRQVEFKALTGNTYNSTTALGHLKKATKKEGVEVIDLDIRKPGGTKADARSLYERFKGTDAGKSYNGEVRIATEEGMLIFNPAK